jgi:hypothetical protein
MPLGLGVTALQYIVAIARLRQPGPAAAEAASEAPGGVL